MSENKITSEKIYDGRVIKLRVDEVETETGFKSKREVVSHGGGAAILVVEGDKILLERQFRYPYGEVIWEIPAGKRDAGEDFLSTAKRELEEETGLVSDNLIKLFDIYPSPGYTDEIIAIFFTDKFTKGSRHLDEGEDLTCEWVDSEKVFSMIDNGEIKDSKTLVALLWFRALKK